MPRNAGILSPDHNIRGAIAGVTAVRLLTGMEAGATNKEGSGEHDCTEKNVRQ